MNYSKLLICSALFGVLSACGGGSGGEDSTIRGTPEGVYQGTTSSNKVTQTIVLENGLYYTIYGVMMSNVLAVEGFITGTGQSNNGTFTSTNLKDFLSNATSKDGSLTATYVPGEQFNGTVNFDGSSVNFTSTAPQDSTYNYNTPAVVSSIVGAWTLADLSGSFYSMNIVANGTFTASSGGCNIGGTFTPRASGKNVYDVTIAFGLAPCPLPNQTVFAHAVTYTVNGGRQLIIAGTDASRINGSVLIGAR